MLLFFDKLPKCCCFYFRLNFFSSHFCFFTGESCGSFSACLSAVRFAHAVCDANLSVEMSMFGFAIRLTASIFIRRVSTCWLDGVVLVMRLLTRFSPVSFYFLYPSNISLGSFIKYISCNVFGSERFWPSSVWDPSIRFSGRKNSKG